VLVAASPHMDRILRQLCSLLDSDDVELQCSAARVLGELHSREREITLSLAKHCRTPNLVARNYLLAALERVPGEEALPYLFPLLREGGAVREKAAAIIASVGPPAVREAKRLFPRADEETRKMLVRILGMIGNREACVFLIDCMAADGEDLNASICLALRDAIARMTPQEKRVILRKVDEFLSASRSVASAEKTAAGIVLIGCLGDPAALGRLLGYAAADQPPIVRERALATVSRMELPPRSHAEIAAALIPMLSESANTAVVRSALAILQRIEIPKKMVDGLEARMRSPNPAVRSFVLSQLGRVDSEENIGKLLAHLNSGDFQERRAAQEALAGIPSAAPRIVRELDAVRDYEAGMRLVSIIRAQRDRLKAGDVRHLFERMEALREEGNPLHAVYAAALQVVDPDFLPERIMARVKRLKAARRFREAEDLLRFLVRHARVSPEMKYELAVAHLRTSLPDLAALSRRDDEGLRLIGELVSEEGFPLLKRLKADRALGPVELYHIGFHFAERLFAQRELGVALLSHVAAKWPRSKMARPARQKLALVGAAG